MDDVTIRFESASCIIKQRRGFVWLTNVYARKRGLGHGTRLMERVIKYADDQRLDLWLDVHAYNSALHRGILSNAQLIDFYQKFGFEIHHVFRGETTMRRSWKFHSRE